MPDNTPETQALLPVTAEYSRGRWSAFDHIANFINALDTADMTAKDVRTAIYAECLEAPVRQSSSNAGGVDRKRIEDCINAAIGHGEHGLFVDVEKATESILASLSTPTAEPMGEGDPLHDLRRSVAEKQAARERDNPPVYADPSDPRFAVGATTPPTPDRIGKALFEALEHSDAIDDLLAGKDVPAPGRIGKDAVREALREAAETLSWAARRMKGNCSGSDIDAVNLAAGNAIRALSATPAQEEEGRWTLVHCSHCDELPQEDKS